MSGNKRKKIAKEIRNEVVTTAKQEFSPEIKYVQEDV